MFFEKRKLIFEFHYNPKKNISSMKFTEIIQFSEFLLRNIIYIYKKNAKNISLRKFFANLYNLVFNYFNLTLKNLILTLFHP